MRPARPSILFYFVFLGMELSYLYLLASLLSGPAYILVLMLLLYPLALLSKLMPRSTFPHRLRFGLELALVILVILVVAGERLLSTLAGGQADIAGIVLRMGFCGLIWLLGYTVPSKEVNYSTIAFRLQVGLLVVLVFSQIAGSAWLVLLFFLLAPLALFLARWASSFSHRATALRSPNLNQLLVAGASVMVPGIALTLLLTPGVAHAIVDWMNSILLRVTDWLDARYKAAMTPSTGFKFDIGCSIRPPVESTPPSLPVPPTPPEGTTGISPVVIWVIVLIIFLGIIALIALALRKRKARRKAPPVEPAQFQVRMVSLSMLRSLISLFPQLLKGLWLWLISLLQSWKKRPRPPEEPLISIRALYRNLLWWTSRQGVAHVPSQTPLERLELLVRKFPQQQDDLKQVTEAYLVARYSQRPVSQEEFYRVEKAWQRAVAYHAP